MTEYEALRRQDLARFEALWPAFVDRTTWSEERLRLEREERLRVLIKLAKERSPWHRSRLALIDPESFSEADLRRIPPMTKADLMENFDAILTDQRLSRELAETHLSALTEDAYLLDEFHVVASGGSSGARGVFVYDRSAWTIFALTLWRFRLRHERSDPLLGPGAVRAALAAGKASHISYALPRTFREVTNATPIPAALPVPEIVSRLNALRPPILVGYPSVLYALAHEALAGRLVVAPRMIGSNSEPLLPEMRAAMEQAWQCPILNAWGASEGVAAGACGQGPGLHLVEDVCIFELMNEDGEPVEPGARAAKIYVTNLYNTSQPLIRYELTDEVLLIDGTCPCGSGMRRIDDVQGRSDDVFRYPGNVMVHPLVFRSPLGSQRNILEYQVRQTLAGAEVELCVQGDVDAAALTKSLELSLRAAGVREPEVAVHLVASLDRQQVGKLKRFIALPR